VQAWLGEERRRSESSILSGRLYTEDKRCEERCEVVRLTYPGAATRFKAETIRTRFSFFAKSGPAPVSSLLLHMLHFGNGCISFNRYYNLSPLSVPLSSLSLPHVPSLLGVFPARPLPCPPHLDRSMAVVQQRMGHRFQPSDTSCHDQTHQIRFYSFWCVPSTLLLLLIDLLY
jgi:hypothetical protein